MRPLPPPITMAEIPEYFSPSQLASCGGCLLRAVLGSSRADIPSLNSHPSAEIGKVFHRLLELSARGRIRRSGSAEEDVKRCLDELITEARRRLEGDPATEAYADLSRTMAPLVWSQKVSMVIGIAVRLLKSSAVPTSRGARKHSLPLFDSLPTRGKWAEVQIKAPRLRLAGRVDLVEKRPGIVVIRDLKSGRVEDREGQILPHIDLQLRMYGIMAQELEPDVDIHLCVDTGVEREVPFDGAIAEATFDWLTDLLNGLPPDREAGAAGIARPGDPCRYCPYRHTCEAYLSSAPLRWRSGSAEPLPLDIWGDVEALGSRPAGLVDITLRDVAGRRVKVFGVLMAHLGGTTVGDRLYFFGLRGRPQSVGDGLWQHPLNFFEVSEDTPRDRAWSLEVFRGQ